MITVSNLVVSRDGRELYRDASFLIHPGWKVGLTGANGSGKSTFFALLLGDLTPDGGRLERPAVWTVAHMAQEVPALAQSALDYVLDGDAELRALEGQLAAAEQEERYEDLANFYQRYEEIGGYTAPSRAAKLLAGLGFSDEEQQKSVADFSGGWRMRINLAQTLMCRSDLLLLDEPTNHLDLDAILWLEDWLRAYPGTLVMVSHDRDFLDAVVEHVLHVEQGTITHYRGNYSAFERMRAERLAQQQQAFEKQQSDIAHLTKYIDRFRAQATKARQAQSRIKALERMTMIAPAHVDSQFSFRFRDPERLPSPLIRMDDVDCGYAERRILQRVNLSLTPDSRIGLLGPNGAGKSTLIKTLVGELALLSGERTMSEHTKIGYFAQHQVDHLDLKASPLLQLTRIAGRTDELTLRKFLGSFGFGGDRIDTSCENFSGGEKARLALALIVWQRPNVLLLDEPTNHLDLEMRHALTLALQEYQGALVVVSHERHLLKACCDDFLLVADGHATPFAGDLEDYADWLRQWRLALVADRAPAKKPDGKKAAGSGASQRATSEAPAASSSASSAKATAPAKMNKEAKKALDKAEKQLALLQERQQALEARLADGELYDSGRRHELDALLAEKAEVDASVTAAEEAWMAASEAMEG
ncbi:MAG TPA: ATP-binding cassette domain-containing protein [Moraxellaceae bacterium]|nr:ATP-binding cassette domain-containing protein [Moraxellaceae bacterium]